MSDETTAVQATRQNKIIVHDDSEFSALLDTGKFEQMWRISGIFSESQLVPVHFQGEKGRSNCFLGLQMAFRLGVDPMMLLQNTYIVGGRPGMEAKMVIALINSSGLFEDALDYEIEGGSDAKAKTYRVRAYATRKGTGKTVYGPWIDWAMVDGEGWSGKSGSKWKSLPNQMFCYRAAAFFGRLHCPERLMGMQTKEELQDIIDITPDVPKQKRAAAILDKFEKVAESSPDPAEIPMTEEEKAEIKPEPETSSGNLQQEVFELLAKLAELKGETADDVIDSLTNHKIGSQGELIGRPDAYLNDIKMMVIRELGK